MPTTRYADLWVCVCCMLAAENGECCERHAETDGGPYVVEIHPDARFYASADAVTVPGTWTLWEGTDGHAAMGGVHAEGCPNGPDSDTRGECDCDCETIEFSRASCDGCGSTLHGTRHAFVWFGPED